MNDRQAAGLSTLAALGLLQFPKSTHPGANAKKSAESLTNPTDPNGGFPSAHTGKETPRSAGEAKEPK